MDVLSSQLSLRVPLKNKSKKLVHATLPMMLKLKMQIPGQIHKFFTN